MSSDKQNGGQKFKILTLYLNYLITKQSAELNNNYLTGKSSVNILTHKSPEDKNINLSLSELKYARANHDSITKYQLK